VSYYLHGFNLNRALPVSFDVIHAGKLFKIKLQFGLVYLVYVEDEGHMRVIQTIPVEWRAQEKVFIR
jgi:hypothetical protein